LRENVKPERKEVGFEDMHWINLAQAVIWSAALNTVIND
jgi:hypothetical protein